MNTADNAFVPQENLEIFRLIYTIEVGLRELLIETLKLYYSNAWVRQGLPGDIKKRYNEGREYEKQTPWVSYTKLDLIYYLDFPDLKMIIENGNNWNNIYKEIFINKEVISNLLKEVEPIRNKVAHNRVATSSDLKLVQANYSKLLIMLGNDRFNELAARTTKAPNIYDILVALNLEAKHSYESCSQCKELLPLKTWDSVKNEWWFQEDILNNDLSAINLFFNTVKGYELLPRSRGKGHEIQAWILKENIAGKYKDCDEAIQTIIKDY